MPTRIGGTSRVRSERASHDTRAVMPTARATPPPRSRAVVDIWRLRASLLGRGTPRYADGQARDAGEPASAAEVSTRSFGADHERDGRDDDPAPSRVAVMPSSRISQPSAIATTGLT